MSFTGDNKAKVNGYINAQNLVERVETWVDNPFFGDMPFEAIYSSPLERAVETARAIGAPNKAKMPSPRAWAT